MVSKVFEKFANNRIVDHLKNGGLFSDFQYGFTGVDPEILKGGGALCQPPWLASKKDFMFPNGLKRSK